VIVEIYDIDDCAFCAIRANTTRKTQIVNNNCLRSGEMAIFVEFAFRNATVIGNTIVGAANGISSTNLDHGGAGSIIRGNIVRDITAPGPYRADPTYFGNGISVEADSVVSDNTITNTNSYGINVGWGPYLRDVNVINNTITHAEIGIGVTSVDGAGHATIESNRINARNGAIRSHQWTEIAEIDLAEQPSAAPDHVKVINNRVI
ncbi:MAG: TIGR03808 family TAT-translocated repetitive protein, partial [Pseudomonadota bacterium]